jgi:transcription elongation GreA/GreB family factor
MSGQEYMTAEGLERLEAQLLALQEQLKSLRAYKGEEAIHAGDTWHDNPVLYQTEAQERTLMRSIAETEVKIRNAVIIAAPQQASSVAMGCKVKVRFPDGSVETFRILGEADSAPRAGVISYKSPLGRALMNKAVGEEVAYQVGGSIEQVEILSIAAD